MIDMELTPSIIVIRNQQLDRVKMFVKNQSMCLFLRFCVWLLFTANVYGHDPLFSPGPHVLFKSGTEIHTEFVQSKQGDERESQQAIALKHGLSGDWVVGLELPYDTVKDEFSTQKGIGDITLSSKYRFWRKDTLGVQETAAIIAKIKLDTGDKQVGSGTTDTLLGFAYGYESLSWYRWASIRYRFNQNRSIQNLGDLYRGDRLFVDFAAAYRSNINNYREIDRVWLLELNGEYSERNSINDVDLNNTGGSQWFVSPGIMWTLRNFAIKAGVQIPVFSNLNGEQDGTDYRARLEFEWHM